MLFPGVEDVAFFFGFAGHDVIAQDLHGQAELAVSAGLIRQPRVQLDVFLDLPVQVRAIGERAQPCAVDRAVGLGDDLVDAAAAFPCRPSASRETVRTTCGRIAATPSAMRAVEHAPWCEALGSVMSRLHRISKGMGMTMIAIWLP